MSWSWSVSLRRVDCIRGYVPGPWQAKAPRDLTLPLVNGQRQLGVLDAIRFPSDPSTVVLEDNHVAFKLRSDSSSILQSVESQLFDDSSSPAYVGDLFAVSSKRVGFLGRGFGTTSAAKTLAESVGVAGADQMAEGAARDIEHRLIGESHPDAAARQHV